jgi:hypothetical protein
MWRVMPVAVFASVLVVHGLADLDIASDLIEEENAMGFQVDGTADVPIHSGQQQDRHEFQQFYSKQKARERPECNMDKAKTGDIEMLYWCGWSLFVSSSKPRWLGE